MKFLLCVVLLFGAAVKAQQEQDYAFPDYWQNDDYDSLYNYNDVDSSNENTDLKDSEIQNIKQEIDDQNELNDKKDVMEDYQIEDNRSNPVEKEPVENQQAVVQDPFSKDASEKSEDLSVLPLKDTQKNLETPIPLPIPSTQDNRDILKDTKDILNEDSNGFIDDKLEESEQDENRGVMDDIAQLIEETQKILEDTDDAFEENDEIIPEKRELDRSENNDADNEKKQEQSEKDLIDGNIEENISADIQEQEKSADDMLQELLDAFDEAEKQEQSNSEEDTFNENYDDNFGVHDQEQDKNEDALPFAEFEEAEKQEQDKSEEDVFSENNDEIEEDTPEKVYADLNADLDKLFETLNKLSEDNSDEENESVDDTNDNVLEYEEKFNKPFHEDAVLAWRDAEVEDADKDPNQSDENNTQELHGDDANNNKSAEDIDALDELESDDYEVINDSNLSEIFKENAKIDDNKSIENDNDEQKLVVSNEKVAESDVLNDEKKENVMADSNDAQEILDYVENEGSDNEPNADDDIDSVIKQIFSEDIKEPLSYGNDGLVDENQPKNDDAEQIETTTKIEETAEQKSVMVDDLSSAELSDLMSQFTAVHEEEFRVNSDSFKRDSEPIHITIYSNIPTEITSPNYPDNYPTGQTVDWIIEGAGMGIEMNITDFAVNGALGDYLLVKPGGVNESGADGLIFSYRLNKERRYRFADVNQMFVRFEAKPGVPFFTGFSFSVKLIWPLQDRLEDIPEPEPVITAPRYTLTLNLAGLSLPQFMVIKEKFMELVADMASAYIMDHGIEFGSAPPLECLQVTKTAVCNIHWPDYDTCVEITFGIPLQYEDLELEHRLNEEDLNNMWTNYTQAEEFATRLRELGITEYMIPDDRSILTVWLVIAGGVVISMAMLAFALWRFSCFEDYTRMRAYSDTDSIKNEKRNLDLYPTPHQTLPPLYSESDYKWADEKYDDATRVDMGGFANKSYVRDDLFEYESDEDVITTRDRNGVISPRDIYKV